MMPFKVVVCSGPGGGGIERITNLTPWYPNPEKMISRRAAGVVKACARSAREHTLDLDKSPENTAGNMFGVICWPVATFDDSWPRPDQFWATSGQVW